MNLRNEYNQNVLQLYKIALSEIQKHEAVYTSSLKEAIINPESVKLLKKIFAAIPKMYQIFIMNESRKTYESLVHRMNRLKTFTLTILE